MMYLITLSYFDGSCKTFKTDDFDHYTLIRMVEKCEIKSYTVELAPLCDDGE